MKFEHVPVMPKEIVELLAPKKGGSHLDCTLGGGGHFSLVAKEIGRKGVMIGIDKDIDAINHANEKFAGEKNMHFIRSDFKNACEILDEQGEREIDSILIDLGVSSHQINTPERGFSFRFDALLDMRMDTRDETTAKTILNEWSEESIRRILADFGEEKFAYQITKAIVAERKKAEIQTTFQLKNIIEKSVPPSYRFKECSKKTFQALRIAVNGELDNLSAFLEKLIMRLSKGGRIAILSFHSLEDRIVKNVFKKMAAGCICPPRTPICICGNKPKIKIITKHPLVASEDELQQNPRATCAKLRVCEKI